MKIKNTNLFKNFVMPAFIPKSKIQDFVNSEVKRAIERKEKEYKRKEENTANQHRLEIEGKDKKYNDDIKALEEKCELKIKTLTIEKDNEIDDLQQEVEDLYKWINKFQETYKEYLFRINDAKKLAVKVSSFVDQYLKDAGTQLQNIMKLQSEIERSVEKEDDKKEFMSKAMKGR